MVLAKLRQILKIFLVCCIFVGCSQTDSKKPKDEVTYKRVRQPKPKSEDLNTGIPRPDAADFKYLPLTEEQVRQTKSRSKKWTDGDIEQYAAACQTENTFPSFERGQCLCLANYLSHLSEVPVNSTLNGFSVTMKDHGVDSYCQARAIDPVYAGRAGFWRVAMRQSAERTCETRQLDECACLVSHLSQAIHFADFLHISANSSGDLDVELAAVAGNCP